jgi:predicted glutamine amidotransferase
MCGIVGSLVLGQKGYADQQIKIQKSLLFLSTVRGVDGTGIAVGGLKDTDKVFTLKDAKPATDVVDASVMHEMMHDSRWTIAHCRAATRGSMSVDGCHPFAEGEVCGVHNGTINNMDIKFPSLTGHNDSHVVYKALAEVEPEQATTVLAKLNPGAYALAWYDKRLNALRFARNGQRPLWFYKHQNMWTWASEPGIIAAAIGREYKDQLAYRNIVPMQLDTHTLLTVPVDGGDATVEEYEPERYVANLTPRQPVVSDSRQGNLWSPRTQEEAEEYERWWAGGDDTETRLTPKDGWLSIEDTRDVWNAPQWLAPYKVHIFHAIQWALKLPAGQVPGCSVMDFRDDLACLAGQLGNSSDADRRVLFTALHVNSTSGMVYGAVSADRSRTFPVVGLLSTSQLEIYKTGLSVVNARKRDVVPLFEGELVSLNAYCDGTIGLRLDSVALSGWESAELVTPDEYQHGGEEAHPHLNAVRFPEMIDWSNWK